MLDIGLAMMNEMYSSGGKKIKQLTHKPKTDVGLHTSS